LARYACIRYGTRFTRLRLTPSIILRTSQDDTFDWRYLDYTRYRSVQALRIKIYYFGVVFRGWILDQVENDTLSYPLSSRSFVVPITSGFLQDDRSLGGTGQAPLRLLATTHSTGATSITLGTGQYRLCGEGRRVVKTPRNDSTESIRYWKMERNFFTQLAILSVI
jgi:hypothetical protein